jgi:hypothetical protein
MRAQVAGPHLVWPQVRLGVGRVRGVARVLRVRALRAMMARLRLQRRVGDVRGVDTAGGMVVDRQAEGVSRVAELGIAAVAHGAFLVR